MSGLFQLPINTIHPTATVAALTSRRVIVGVEAVEKPKKR